MNTTTNEMLGGIVFLTLALGLATACAIDEIDSSDDPFADRASSEPASASNDGGVRVDARIPPPTTTTTDASPSPPMAPLGCLAPTELEPNDSIDRPQRLSGSLVCAALSTGTDVDVFSSESGSTARTFRFLATADAELEVSGYGFKKVVKNAGVITVPSFGTSLKFMLRIHSPASAAQVYRIDVDD